MSRRSLWLFSPALDLVSFVLPLVVSLVVVSALVGTGSGSVQGDPPLAPWLWLCSVVLVDVAHVYATVYRLYPAELGRRPTLYLSVPLVCYGLSVLAYAASPLTFWRCMAYLAVFHFVRQQYGWVVLSGRRQGVGPLDRILDAAAVYAGTLYPILYWHVHLPRRFHWFVAGDFAAIVPPGILKIATPVWITIGVLWLGRQVWEAVSGRPLPVGKWLIMGSTWLTWYLGIIHYNSDLAFTVTNVLAHGIPYIAVLYRFDKNRRKEQAGPRQLPPGLVPVLVSIGVFLLPLFGIAYLEEAIWDRLVWHEHGMLFPGPSVDVGPGILLFLVPLLSLPQSAHYALDAWIWKGAKNPDLRRYL